MNNFRPSPILLKLAKIPVLGFGVLLYLAYMRYAETPTKSQGVILMFAPYLCVMVLGMEIYHVVDEYQHPEKPLLRAHEWLEDWVPAEMTPRMTAWKTCFEKTSFNYSFGHCDLEIEKQMNAEGASKADRMRWQIYKENRNRMYEDRSVPKGPPPPPRFDYLFDEAMKQAE